MAVSLGGPGATLWMMLAGFLGMSLKFAEVTLSVKYRRVRADGTVTGGAMHYVPEALGRVGMPRLGFSPRVAGVLQRAANAALRSR